MRHLDFERILSEFVKYYKSQKEGEKQYYDWINDLGIDETKPYGYGFEAFRFAKDKISLWKEDEENKYYKVLVGFPLESMNGHVYYEDELKKAAHTLKGITPDLNHWTDVPLMGVAFVGADYEDGAVESVLKVPKSLICPECGKEKKFYEYIDEKHIVNVSLECSCEYRDANDGCRGMKFTGCALLTKDTLPGIPLARIFPLESIMREALTRGHHKEKKPMSVTVVGLSSNEAQLNPGGPNNPPTKHPKQPDGHGQCPEGMMWSPSQGKCVELVEDQTGGKAPPEGTNVQMGTPAATDTSHKSLLEYVSGVDYIEDRQGERDFKPTAEWPDSCYGYVPASAKGPDGKKSDRKIPWRWPDGEVSWKNVSNALSRLAQPDTEIPDSERTRLTKLFQGMMAKQNPDYKPSQEDLKERAETLVKISELELKLFNSESYGKTAEERALLLESKYKKEIEKTIEFSGSVKNLTEKVGGLETKVDEKDRALIEARKDLLDAQGKLKESMSESAAKIREAQAEADRLIQKVKAEAETRVLEAERSIQKAKADADSRVLEADKLTQKAKSEADTRVLEADRSIQKFKAEADSLVLEARGETQKALHDGKTSLEEAQKTLQESNKTRDTYKTQMEAEKARADDLDIKYQKVIAENLELSKSLTTANEATLKVSKERDETLEKLKKARRLSKAVVSI